MDKVVVAMATQIFGAGLRGVPQDQSGEIQFDVPTCNMPRRHKQCEFEGYNRLGNMSTTKLRRKCARARQYKVLSAEVCFTDRAIIKITVV